MYPTYQILYGKRDGIVDSNIGCRRVCRRELLSEIIQNLKYNLDEASSCFLSCLIYLPAFSYVCTASKSFASGIEIAAALERELRDEAQKPWLAISMKAGQPSNAIEKVEIPGQRTAGLDTGKQSNRLCRT